MALRLFKKYWPFLLSLLLHLAVLGLPLGGSGDSESETSGSGKVKVEGEAGTGVENSGDIVPKQVEIELFEIPKGQGEELPQTPAKPVVKNEDAIKECENDDWYGGVGIYQSGGGLITWVVAGYPADKAGLREGDVVRSIKNKYGFESDFRGDVGEAVKVIVYRPSTKEAFEVKIVREKICTRGAEKI